MLACNFSYEQQLEELQTTQSQIVSELHQKQEASEAAKEGLRTLENTLQEAESKKQSVRYWIQWSYVHCIKHDVLY